LQPKNEGNAIKESKVKETKGKERKGLKESKLGILSNDNLKSMVEPSMTPESSAKGKKMVKKGESLVFPFKSQAFLAAFDILKAEKKWIKKSSAAHQASLNKLAAFGEAGAIESINDAISGAYQGVFAPKSFQQQNQINKPQQKINAFEEAKKILNNDSNNNNAD